MHRRRARVVEVLHGLGFVGRFISGFAALGFFLNLILSPWDRAYAAGVLTLGTVGVLLGFFLPVVPHMLGGEWKAEARRHERATRDRTRGL